MVQRLQARTQMRAGRDGGRPGPRRRYPDPVDTPDPDPSDQARASGEDPLLRALREENQRLRSQNQQLAEQMRRYPRRAGGAGQAPSGDRPASPGAGDGAAARWREEA